MKQPKSPCFHCEIRQPACQSVCKEFSLYAKKHKEYKELVDRVRENERNFNDFKYERTALMKKLAR